VMANTKKFQRQAEEAQARATYWEEKAELAVKKGRDDLAREALMEKRRYTERMDTVEKEVAEQNGLVDQYQEDIRQLEDRLRSAQEKQGMLVQRHIRASKRRRAQEEIRRVESAEAIVKFEDLENRIDRMEAEADMVNFGRRPSLETEFESLAGDEDIEKELKTLKSSLTKGGEGSSQG